MSNRASHPIQAAKAGGNIVSQKTVFSLNTNFLATVSEKRILIFSTATGERVRTLYGHNARVTSIFLNPFNTLQLYSVGLDGCIRLWDYEEGITLVRAFVKECPNEILYATPSLTESGVIYVIARTQASSHKLYRIYVGVAPPPQSDQQNKFKKENISEAEAKLAVFGSGIIGADGKEIIKPSTSELSEEQYKQKLDDFYEQIEYFPTQIQKIKDGKAFFSEQFIRVTTHTPIGLASNKHALYILFAKAVEVHLFKPNLQFSHIFFGPSDISFTEMSLHPTEDVIALSVVDGSIQFLRPLSDKPSITETYHWHTKPCTTQFSDDGLYLLSGSIECVLVVWQLSTGKKQFFPNLGSKISSISVTSDSKYYAISTVHNCIHIFHPASSKIVHTISSIIYDEHSSRRVVIEPKNGFIVSEGVPGVLQFYNPVTDRHGPSLTVARNAINVDNSHNSYIRFLKFSWNGDWLVTVDVRQVASTSISIGAEEIRNRDFYSQTKTHYTTTMKFWNYNQLTKSYELNSQVTPPHDKVTSVSFHPTENIVVTTGKDGKFIFWTTGKKENKTRIQSKQNGISEAEKSEFFWYCKSVGFYNHRPAHASCFSEDGSLLAISYDRTITLWDPETITLKHTLNFTVSDYHIKELHFITKTPYLISANRTHFFVWNLLSLSVWWYSELYKIKSIAVDPINPRFSILFRQYRDSPNTLHPFNPTQLENFSIDQVIPELKGKAPLESINYANYATEVTKRITSNGKRTNIQNNLPETIKDTCEVLIQSKIDSQLSMPIPPLEYFSQKAERVEENYLVCFSASSHVPVSVTPLKNKAGSNVVYLDADIHNCPEEYPLVGYLSGYSFFFQGPVDFMKETIRSHKQTETKQAPVASTFADIFGDLKHIQDQFINDGQSMPTPFSASTRDNDLLNASTHLIPSIPLLYSSFIDSLLAKSLPSTSSDNTEITEQKKEYDVDGKSAEMEVDDALNKPSYFDEKHLLSSEIIPDFDILKHPEYNKLSKQFSQLNVE